MKKTTTVAKKTATKAAVATIGKIEAATLIKGTNGKIFSATFTKKDGEERLLTGKLKNEVKAKGKKPAPDVSALGMIRVYDMVGNQWRMLNLQTISKIKAGGKVYNVR